MSNVVVLIKLNKTLKENDKLETSNINLKNNFMTMCKVLGDYEMLQAIQEGKIKL